MLTVPELSTCRPQLHYTIDAGLTLHTDSAQGCGQTADANRDPDSPCSPWGGGARAEWGPAAADSAQGRRKTGHVARDPDSRNPAMGKK